MQTFKPTIKTPPSFLSWLAAGLVFLLPLFFLPITSEFYNFSKLILLNCAVGILLLAWLIKLVSQPKITLVKNPLNWPVLFIGLTFIASTLLQSPNKMAAFLGPTGLVINLCLLYLVIINNQGQVKILWGFLAGNAVLAILTILSVSGLIAKFGAVKTWTPTGSPISTALLLLVFLPATLFWAVKTKKAGKKIILFGLSLLELAGLGMIVFLLVNKSLTLTYLDPRFGWQISLEGLKDFRTALFGVGPGNFLSAFNRFRPIGLNQTNLWNVKFTSNSNQYLNLLSTVGILGLLAYLWLIIKSLKTHIKGNLTYQVCFISLVISFILQLFFSANLLLLTAVFILTASLVQKKDFWEMAAKGKWIFVAVLFLVVFLNFYWQARVFRAELTFALSLKAAQANKGAETYNLQLKAINLNPWQENYRLAYANTNLALANSMAAQKDLSDQKKENIAKLVSQAVNEAKNLIRLNPKLSSYWLNLAQIYRSLIGVSDQAGQWTAASLLEAVKTDPTNPLLRLELGGLFYSVKNYDEAVTQFQQAANLKPDFANAYYNLASAYREKQDWQKAYLSLQEVLNLLPEDNPDWQKVKTELEEVKAKLPQAPEVQPNAEEKKNSEPLTTPSALPSAQPQLNRVKLPQNLGPENPEATKSGKH